MSSVPEDIYLEILARLPVKSLLTCKCVCKSWFQIVSSHSFVNMHLTHAKHQRSNASLMFIEYHRTSRTNNCMCQGVYTIGYDSIVLESNDVAAVKKDHPFEHEAYGYHRWTQLCGSCNGLVYFWNDSRKLFCLWNPGTREYKVIPKSSENYAKDDIHICGFGYDHKMDDYKVINVAKPYKGRRHIVDVYTLGTNSWRSSHIELDRVLFSSKNGVLVNGALHWFSKKLRLDEWVPGKRPKLTKLIMSLEISSEKFIELEPPKVKRFFSSMGVLEGLLCLLANVYKLQVEVWVMQEYGVRESWRKRYIITHEEIIKNTYDTEIVWSFEKGEILFWNGSKLVLYDPKDKSARELSIRSMGWLDALNYCESLVSVNSATYVGGKQD